MSPRSLESSPWRLLEWKALPCLSHPRPVVNPSTWADSYRTLLATLDFIGRLNKVMGNHLPVVWVTVPWPVWVCVKLRSIHSGKLCLNLTSIIFLVWSVIIQTYIFLVFGFDVCKFMMFTVSRTWNVCKLPQLLWTPRAHAHIESGGKVRWKSVTTQACTCELLWKCRQHSNGRAKNVSWQGWHWKLRASYLPSCTSSGPGYIFVRGTLH